MTDASTNAIHPDKIRRNAFTDDLGTDWIAVAHDGTVVTRSSDRQGAERAAPQAAGYFTGRDLDQKALKDQPRQATDNSNGAAQEAVMQQPAQTYEEILAHVERTHDTEANHEEQKKTADKVVAEQHAAKVDKAREDKHDLEKRGADPASQKAVTDVLSAEDAGGKAAAKSASPTLNKTNPHTAAHKK